VFEPAAASGEWSGFRAHSTAAVEPEGQVLSLPETLRPPKTTEAKAAPVWRDSLTQPRHEPEEQLRQQEVRQVALAISDLVAQGRRPGDIMVLARKRVALRAVSEALSERQLPHVMPEPMNLGDEAEARDLLAVLDVLSSRGQDLSLAIALKSPLFGARTTNCWPCRARRADVAAGGRRCRTLRQHGPAHWPARATCWPAGPRP
jgi:ATP-dependent helicase/nuclease subunit A